MKNVDNVHLKAIKFAKIRQKFTIFRKLLTGR